MKRCNCHENTCRPTRGPLRTNSLSINQTRYFHYFKLFGKCVIFSAYAHVCSLGLPAVKQQLSKTHPSFHLVQQVLLVVTCPLDLIRRTSCSESGQVAQRKCHWNALQRQLHKKHGALGVEEGRPPEGLRRVDNRRTLNPAEKSNLAVLYQLQDERRGDRLLYLAKAPNQDNSEKRVMGWRQDQDFIKQRKTILKDGRKMTKIFLNS